MYHKATYKFSIGAIYYPPQTKLQEGILLQACVSHYVNVGTGIPPCTHTHILHPLPPPPPEPEMATEAGCTHPAGMHSCIHISSWPLMSYWAWTCMWYSLFSSVYYKSGTLQRFRNFGCIAKESVYELIIPSNFIQYSFRLPLFIAIFFCRDFFCFYGYHQIWWNVAV